MGKISLFFLIVVFVMLGLFSYSNNEPMDFRIPFGAEYEVSKIAFMIFSIAFGAASMLVLFMIRDTRRFIATYQLQKRQRKEERLQVLYSKAVNAILADDEPEARGYLEDILKEEPEHEDALLRLGDVTAKRENFEEARELYRRVLDGNPRNIEAMLSLDRVYQGMQRRKEALEVVEGILDIDPDNLTALHRKRGLLEREGRWDELVDLQKLILKHAHTDRQQEQAALVGYRYELARDALEKGQLDKANKGFRVILREEKGFVPAYLGVAEVMLREGENEDAVNFLEGGYEQTASEIILARIEDMLINLGEPYRLIKTYRAAISRDPGNGKLRFLLGKLYFRLEMIDDAIETLSSPDLADSYAETFQILGELYLRRNQCEKAVAEFKKGVNMKKSLRLPYYCDGCGHVSEDWSGRCPECGKWNTYRFNLHGAGKT